MLQRNQQEVGVFVSQNLSLIAFARHVAMHASPVRFVRGLLVLFFALVCGTALAQGSPADASFEHAKTGFNLGAQHISARCESCHTQGVFRGTPRECAQCHRNSGRPTATQFPVRHIPTIKACDTCHRASAWNVVKYRHEDVVKGTCNSCHNGIYTIGKPTSHQPVIGSCDLCHNTLTWTATRYDHTGVAAGSCANCHNNIFAKGKGVKHPPDGGRACDVCHTTNLWVPATYPHAPDVWGRCSTCHDNVTAKGKTAGVHIPDNRQCDTCHRSTSSFVIRTMDHTGLDGQCLTCHNGTYVSQNALDKTSKPGHVPTAAQCDTCHSTVAWKPANFTHDASTSGTCNTCHNGVTALGKNSGHIPTNAQCDTCHASTTNFLGALMNHTGMAGQCSNCHNGGYLAQNAQAKSSSHVSTNAQCDSSGCHSSTTSWATTTFNHALAAPPVLIGDHTCATCHKAGGPGLPKPSTHIPTNGACDNCHGNFNQFKPANMDHTGTSGTCTTCHSGGYASIGSQGAQAKPTSHIPTSSQCDTCHTNFVAFRPATMNHTGMAGTCTTCHSGGYVAVGALAKPATHTPTALQCDSCHKTVAWIPASFAHDATATRRCSVCHNGTNATGKGNTHIPDNRQCDTCHNNYSSFRPAAMSHVGLTGQCSTCHGGAYLSENAQTKSANHVATSAQCDSSGCHSSTTSWATSTVDHALLTPPAVIGDHSCSTTCHKAGGQGLPKPTNHIPTAAACDTCHTNFGGFKPAFMNHTGTATQCSTCHNGSYLAAGAQGALAKPLSHIPTSMQCDSCHTNGYVAFKPATMNHTGTNGQCSTCHNGAYVSVGSQGALAKPSTHIVTSAQCDSSGCHTSTTTWAGVTFNHTGVTIGGHTCGNAGCHIAGGAGLPKPTNHIPTTAACDTCHTNFSAFKPAQMNHAGLNGQCSTCHSGGYLAQNAQAKSATHVVTSLQCDSSGCHTSTTTWAGATFNHSGVTIGGHTCGNAGCHVTGGTGLPKPGTHIPTTQACDLCHKNFTSFNPATMDHTGTSSQCINCHNGTNATGKPSGRHIPTTQSCDLCHRTSAWLPLLTPYSHTGIAAGTCTNCHSAGYANIDVKPTAHIPTSISCDQCHRATAATWLPVITPYAHTGIAAGSCTTCHTAPYTDIKLVDSNHIPTTAVTAQWASCDACHKSYSTFTGVRLHSTVFTSNSQYPGTCVRCHEYGNPYGLQGRTPSKHTSTARKAPNSCDNSGCHSVRGW
jgi:hypothetical protein